MYKILVVDDHDIVRKRTINALENMDKSLSFGEANSFSQTILMINQEVWDLILMDIAIPENRGKELFDTIKKIHPDIPLLILSRYPEEQYAVSFIKSGAVGYLNKTTTPELLYKAVIESIEGSTFISGKVSMLIKDDQEIIGKKSDDDLHEDLSTFEYYIFEKIALGIPIKKIGEMTGLGVNTISIYRDNLLRTLRITTNAELTIYAIKHNLVGR